MIKIVFQTALSLQGITRDVEMEDLSAAITFSGGEEHIHLKTKPLQSHTRVDIYARLDSSKAIIQLIMVTDAIRRMYNNIDKDIVINLWMPYIPYARQDRVCDSGDAFSLHTFCGIINNMKYGRVYVADSHSYVATALLERCIETYQFELAYPMVQFITHRMPESDRPNYKYVVAPDEGSSKKAKLFARELRVYHNEEIIEVQALKLRDKVGKIIDTQVLHDNFEGADVLMVDDICDGGGTFNALADVLLKLNAGRIGLYVTHGIFSRGIQVLNDAGIVDVYTTDSFGQEKNPTANVIHSFFNYQI